MSRKTSSQFTSHKKSERYENFSDEKNKINSHSKRRSTDSHKRQKYSHDYSEFSYTYKEYSENSYVSDRKEESSKCDNSKNKSYGNCDGNYEEKHEKPWVEHLFDIMAEDNEDFSSMFYQETINSSSSSYTYERVSEINDMSEEEYANYIRKGMYEKQHEQENEYFKKWNEFDIKGDSIIKFQDIPWPIKDITKLTRKNVEEFLLYGINDRLEIKSMLRNEQIRFHPDRWQRFIKRIPTDKQREKIMNTVTEISRTQSSINGYGYHVLKVQEKSPAQKAGIEPFFDYIIGINGISLEPDTHIFQEKLLSNIDKEVKLIPSKTWTDNTENGIIGCIIRYCSYEGINEHVWHILEIAQKSPAEMAADYVIGTPHETLRNESDFYDLVDNHLGRPLRLYVYNSDVDACREVTIVPNSEWGGEGFLGCGVGYGYLHRIPKTYKYQSLKRKFELSWDPSSFPHLNSPNPSPQLVNKDDDNNYSDITTFVSNDSNISNENKGANEIESVENIEITTTTIESGDTGFKSIDEKSE
ncbi:7319_t:CDS:10 [Diversispora eburnea]|uniref:7319_t:CDS:1 n=1 Tax=Diversispora eburnea TaxID=1213867 RepID=A0A9N9A250_9GLOM|nr:7319_t:CDS:10 [Diversispora eburnea]